MIDLKHKLYYLASPYTTLYPDLPWDMEKVIEFRYQNTLTFGHILVEAGYHFVSPILHFHIMAHTWDFPKDFSFWEGMDKTLIEHCNGVIVYCDEHWKDSGGVAREIEYAESLGKPILYRNILLEEVNPNGPN